MQKLFSLAALLLLFCCLANAQQQKYSRVKVYADKYQTAQLAAMGVAADHGETKRGHWFITDLSADEMNIVKSAGLSFDVLIDDVPLFYLNQNLNLKTTPEQPSVQSIGCPTPPNYTTPANFALGSMGGFFTLAEIIGHFDNMANLFPSIFKAKTALPYQTNENRPVYWMKISDNPNVDETEPEVLYTAIHHAREPASVAQLIMYMYYLLENYNSNAEVQYLVNNSEMFFIPLINPDGYFYNETNSPNGGGMWRKNRRNNGNGTYGVDLNRNYGYNWAYDNQGSSGNPSSDTYRGTAAFSEPETRNIRDFCNTHQFRLTVNYHTYGDLLIYPWGYAASTYTPDSAQFTEYGSHLTTHNRYSYGTPDQTVLYSANGTSDDWMYGDQTSKPKIFAFTPEAGQSDEGFWPPQNRIIDICKENIWQNLHVCHLALKYAEATDNEHNYIPNLSGYFNYKIKRLGMDAPATYTVSIIPVSPQITSVGAPRTYSSLALLQEASDSISFTLASNTSNGQLIKYILQVDNGLYQKRDTIVKRYGPPVIVFASNGNNMTGWTNGGTWGTTTSTFYSAPSSIADSPTGNYQDNDVTTLTTSSQLNLTNALSAQVTFFATWQIETNFDYAQILASNDNGNTWFPLCGKYTKAGNGYQDPGQPIYDAYQFGWLYEEISLDAYIGQNILLRLQLVSDNGGTATGFFIDDLKVEKIIQTTVGLSETNEPQLLSQNMPNPADDYTYISYTNVDAGTQVIIYNSLGELVMSQKIEQGTGNIKLNTTSLLPGVYYYCLQNGANLSAKQKMTVIR